MSSSNVIQQCHPSNVIQQCHPSNIIQAISSKQYHPSNVIQAMSSKQCHPAMPSSNVIQAMPPSNVIKESHPGEYAVRVLPAVLDSVWPHPDRHGEVWHDGQPGAPEESTGVVTECGVASLRGKLPGGGVCRERCGH
eukprot:scaffold92984_cov21-Tisochrysis_lutea.AAC.1